MSLANNYQTDADTGFDTTTSSQPQVSSFSDFAGTGTQKPKASEFNGEQPAENTNFDHGFDTSTASKPQVSSFKDFIGTGTNLGKTDTYDQSQDSTSDNTVTGASDDN